MPPKNECGEGVAIAFSNKERMIYYNEGEKNSIAFADASSL